jgi:RNA polymerase sigma factor (sigma-70 family)
MTRASSRESAALPDPPVRSRPGPSGGVLATGGWAAQDGARADLVVQARNGDRAAFETLIDPWIEPAFRTAMAILGNQADARDATLDALLSAWRRIRGLHDGDHFDAWLSRIHVNACRSIRRRRGRSQIREIPIAELAGVNDPPSRGASTVAGAVGLDELQRTFGLLSVEQRTVLVLYHLDHRPVADMARILALPEGTVKWRLHAAREALAQPRGGAATTTRGPFSNATLDAMLQRRAKAADPSDLRGRATDALARTQPRRMPSFGALFEELIPAGRLAPVVALLLLALLLAGVLLVAEPWRERHPISLTPTGVETIATDMTAIRLVEDGAGMLWALGDGQAVRIDPATAAMRMWTISDDAAFAAADMGAARAGGIWVWSGGNLRRFTGERFAETIPTSGRPRLLSEAPDGTLWALSEDGGLGRWAGDQWEHPAGATPVDGTTVAGLLATGPEEVWLAGRDTDVAACDAPGQACSLVAHFQNGEWSVHRWPEPTDAPVSLVQAPDRSVWAGPTRSGLIRFEGDRPEPVDGPPSYFSPERQPLTPLAVAPDGALWAEGGGSLVRRDPRGWWGPPYTDGPFRPYEVSSLVATTDGVFAVSRTSFGDATLALFRIPDGEDGAWAEVWRDEPGPLTGGGLAALVGISVDEAWAADANDRGAWADNDRGPWHYIDGTWQHVSLPSLAHRISRLAAGPDGSLWAANLNRVGVLRSDGWTTAWASEDLLVGGGLDVGPDGSAWVGTYAGVAHLTPAGSHITVRQIDCPVAGATVAAAIDGSVWVGGNGEVRQAGLAHVTDAGCEPVDPRPVATSRLYEVRSIAAEPQGSVLVSFDEPIDGVDWSSGDASVTSSVVRLGHEQVWLLGSAVTRGGSTRVAASRRDDIWWAYDSPAVAPIDTLDGAGVLAHLEADRWTRVVTGVRGGLSVSIASDGTVWFAGPTGIHTIQPDPLQ